MPEDADRHDVAFSLVIEPADAAEDVVIDCHVGVDYKSRNGVAKHLAQRNDIGILAVQEDGGNRVR